MGVVIVCHCFSPGYMSWLGLPIRCLVDDRFSTLVQAVHGMKPEIVNQSPLGESDSAKPDWLHGEWDWLGLLASGKRLGLQYKDDHGSTVFAWCELPPREMAYKSQAPDETQGKPADSCEDPELAIANIRTELRHLLMRLGQHAATQTDWVVRSIRNMLGDNALTNTAEACTGGLSLIAAERAEQIAVHRYDANHDDKHTGCALAEAACCYAHPSPRRNLAGVPIGWPFDDKDYKRTTRVKELAKAGALIAAEIDRLLRVQRAERLLEPLWVTQIQA